VRRAGVWARLHQLFELRPVKVHAVSRVWALILDDNKLPSGYLIEEISTFNIALSYAHPVEHARLYFNSSNVDPSRHTGRVSVYIPMNEIFLDWVVDSVAKLFVDFF
jgi:hypothetical protein